MPPHLHPRSTATSTLFAGTLLASFVVIAIPHLIPCPRPHGKGQLSTEIFIDENGNRFKRVVRRTVVTRKSGGEEQSQTQHQGQRLQPPPQNLQISKSLQDEAALFKQLQTEAEIVQREQTSDRECPVPKPGGTIGRWLGFEGRTVRIQEEAVKE